MADLLLRSKPSHGMRRFWSMRQCNLQNPQQSRFWLSRIGLPIAVLARTECWSVSSSVLFLSQTRTDPFTVDRSRMG